MPHVPEKIAVVGLGYVGLPVAVAFAKHGPVMGYDLDTERVTELSQGRDSTLEVIADELKNSSLRFSSNLNEIAHCNFFVVAVPTPIDRSKKPDLNALCSASKDLGGILKPGDTVVYESTVYPGVTEEICVPLLEAHSSLKAGIDFFVGYSPERVNPGDRGHALEKVKKIVSGDSESSASHIATVYSRIIKAGIHIAPSIRVAEAAKVIENVQRDVNIALMNELSILFHRMDLDTYEVLEAAQTKWNFHPYYPGLVGGHCIGVDPFYLTHKAAELDYHPEMILSGRRVNDHMAHFVAKEVIRTLNRKGFQITEDWITVLGFSFKENVPDFRNTKVADLVKDLLDSGFRVQICDPYCDAKQVVEHTGLKLTSFSDLVPAKAVIHAVRHAQFREGGWNLVKKLLRDESGFVFDLKASLNRNQKPHNIEFWRL